MLICWSDHLLVQITVLKKDETIFDSDTDNHNVVDTVGAPDPARQLPELPDVPPEHGLLQGEEQEAAGGGGECPAGSSQVGFHGFRF